jgi:hypothetical protein
VYEWIILNFGATYESVSRSFRTGRLKRELYMVLLSAISCSCIAVLWVRLVSFAAVTLCFASQWVFIFVNLYLVIDSVRKLLDTPSYSLFLLLGVGTFVAGLIHKFLSSTRILSYLISLLLFCLVCYYQCPFLYSSKALHFMSWASRTLGSWVRILLERWMYVHVLLCCAVLCR